MHWTAEFHGQRVTHKSDLIAQDASMPMVILILLRFDSHIDLVRSFATGSCKEKRVWTRFAFAVANSDKKRRF